MSYTPKRKALRFTSLLYKVQSADSRLKGLQKEQGSTQMSGRREYRAPKHSVFDQRRSSLQPIS